MIREENPSNDGLIGESVMIFSRERIDSLFEDCRNRRIAVVGDLMVDRYFWGEIERISPEAPVPVLELSSEPNVSLGGAANVINNLVSLGVQPVPFGLVGDDANGEMLKQKLREKSVDTSCVFIDAKRPTTTKTRIIARNQHILRLDRESRDDIPPAIEAELISRYNALSDGFDAVIFQDYNKGVVSDRVISDIISVSLKNGICIAVDPKFHNFFQYEGVTIFKPNIKETEAALAVKIRDEADILSCGRRIYERIKPKYLLITRGAAGLTLFENMDEPPAHYSTNARKVHDVSGAGDTVIAALTAFYSAGASIKEAAVIANYAAGAVCEEVGVIPIERERLRGILFREACG